MLRRLKIEVLGGEGFRVLEREVREKEMDIVSVWFAGKFQIGEIVEEEREGENCSDFCCL